MQEKIPSKAFAKEYKEKSTFEMLQKKMLNIPEFWTEQHTSEVHALMRVSVMETTTVHGPANTRLVLPGGEKTVY